LALVAPLADGIEALRKELTDHNMQGFWDMGRELDEFAFKEPRGKFQPYIWKWDDISRLLGRTSDLVGLGGHGETARRTLRLVNPALRQSSNSMTHTLHTSIQLVNPGEVADAHRHTMGAIRFVVEGHDTFTTVENEPFPMEPGDLILTPQWTWHDHENKGSGPMVFVNGVDSPLMQYFGCWFTEPFPDKQQLWTKPVDFTRQHLGLLRPAGRHEPQDVAFRYPYTEARAALALLADGPGDPHDGVLLEYVHPVTGGHTLPTMSCLLQMLRPGERTQAHRHTSSGMFHVVEGRGVTVAGDVRLEWERGDCFAVPNWTPHWHENLSAEGPAILFIVSDRPQLEAFGLYREMSEEEHAAQLAARR
jgi:gentisate 1,2-dioxygenase